MPQVCWMYGRARALHSRSAPARAALTCAVPSTDHARGRATVRAKPGVAATPIIAASTMERRCILLMVMSDNFCRRGSQRSRKGRPHYDVAIQGLFASRQLLLLQHSCAKYLASGPGAALARSVSSKYLKRDWAGGGRTRNRPSACIPRLIWTGKQSACRVANEGDRIPRLNHQVGCTCRFAGDEIGGLQQKSLSGNCRVLSVAALIAAAIILRCKQPSQRMLSANQNLPRDNFDTRAKHRRSQERLCRLH